MDSLHLAGNLGWQILLAVITPVVVSVFVIVKVFMPNVNREEERAVSVSLAQRVASSSHGVRKVEPNKGATRLHLFPRDGKMEDCVLWFFSGHPDFKEVSRIPEDIMFTVEFVFTEVPVKGQAQEATGYLRLKKMPLVL